MANYIARAKNIIGNLKDKDQTLPSNANLKEFAKSLTVRYRSKWVSLIDSDDHSVITKQEGESIVINPDNQDDTTDIGTWDGETFTPATAGEVNSLLALNFIRLVRKYLSNEYKAYKKENATISAEDAGETAEEFKAGEEAEAETLVLSVLGDPKNDPEL